MLTGKELNKLYSKFADVKLLKNKYPKSANGEYMIAVGEKYSVDDKIVIAVRNKVLISERVSQSVVAHDFQVKYAYRFNYNNELANEFKNFLRKEHVEDDDSRIEKAVSIYASLYAEKENIYTYNGDSWIPIGYNTTRANEIQGNTRNEQVLSNQSNGKRNDSSSQSDLQEVPKKLNIGVKASEQGAFSMPENKQYSITDDQADLLKRYENGCNAKPTPKGDYFPFDVGY